MEIIIGLIIAFILLAFLYGILCLIIKKWPVLIWIVGIGSGVILAIITAWWIGAIGGFILIGFLAARHREVINALIAEAMTQMLPKRKTVLNIGNATNVMG